MDGKILAGGIRSKLDELIRLCDNINEQTASQAPEGRWSPKEILSHLLGAPTKGMMHAFRLFIEEENPRLDVEPANAHFTAERKATSLSQLVSQLRKEYGDIAEFTDTLSKDQLSRKAHVPAFKESPFGEYITLETFISILGESHLKSHIDHMQEILDLLRKTPSP
jgi:hypothetical protein